MVHGLMEAIEHEHLDMSQGQTPMCRRLCDKWPMAGGDQAPYISTKRCIMKPLLYKRSCSFPRGGY